MLLKSCLLSLSILAQSLSAGGGFGALHFHPRSDDLLEQYMDPGYLAVPSKQLRQEENNLLVDGLQNFPVEEYQWLDRNQGTLSPGEFRRYMYLNEQFERYQGLPGIELPSTSVKELVSYGNSGVPGVIALTDTPKNDEASPAPQTGPQAEPTQTFLRPSAPEAKSRDPKEFIYEVAEYNGRKVFLSGYNYLTLGGMIKIDQESLSRLRIRGLYGVAYDLTTSRNRVPLEALVKENGLFKIELHPIQDHAMGLIAFEREVDFLTQFMESLQSGENVVVFCAEGRSRAPSILIAWLMKVKGLTLDQAIQNIIDARRDRASSIGSLRLFNFLPQLIGQFKFEMHPLLSF